MKITFIHAAFVSAALLSGSAAGALAATGAEGYQEPAPAQAAPDAKPVASVSTVRIVRR